MNEQQSADRTSSHFVEDKLKFSIRQLQTEIRLLNLAIYAKSTLYIEGGFGYQASGRGLERPVVGGNETFPDLI